MDWIAQSIREYQAVHGVPPSELKMLRVWPRDLLDMYGVPVEYRISESPTRWGIRSTGQPPPVGGRWIEGP